MESKHRIRLIVTSLIPSPATEKVTEDFFIKVHMELRKTISQFGKQNSVFLNINRRVFVKDDIIDPVFFEPDGVHLNKRGADVLASHVVNRLKYLPKNL